MRRHCFRAVQEFAQHQLRADICAHANPDGARRWVATSEFDAQGTQSLTALDGRGRYAQVKFSVQMP